MEELYSFVYKGVLTDESLDKVGRRKISNFGKEDEYSLMKALSFDMLDSENLTEARRMSVVYIAMHAFENSVRHLVKTAMAEKFEEVWWEKVPERIRKRVKTRIEEDQKNRWHGSRGTEEINYCDFGDLSSTIVTNWELFEDVLSNLEWSKSILSALEKSRNIVMHGGIVAQEDVERIGMNIRDWIRQTG
jgi:hypothetical protein